MSKPVKQLRQFDRVEATPLWSAIQARHPGPEAPPPHNRLRRAVVIVSALGLFAIAGAFAWSAFRPSTAPASVGSSDSTALVATLDAPEDGSIPGLTLSYDGGASRDYFAEGGHWPGVKGFNLPGFGFGDPLPPGTSLTIEGDASEVAGNLEVLHPNLQGTGEILPLDLGGGSATLPNDPGFYRLDLTGTWPQGTAEFFVVIHVAAPSSPSETYQNPMGIPISVDYPKTWFANGVSENPDYGSPDPGSMRIGLALSTSNGGKPPSNPTAYQPLLPGDPRLPDDYVIVTIFTSDTATDPSLTDTPLPLSMDHAKVAPGPEDVRTLEANVAGRHLVITVYGGPRASEADLAAADAIVASIQPSVGGPSGGSSQASPSSGPIKGPDPTSDGFFQAPYLAGGAGWDSVSSAPVPVGTRSATTVWASTIPIANEDIQMRAAIPPRTISQLPPDGIVVTVEVAPFLYRDTSGPFPYADLSFNLTTATERGPTAEEPPGDYTVIQAADDQGSTALVRVYFGVKNPSPALIAQAQTELNTLQLPPTCAVSGPGGQSVTVSSTSASPGDQLTLTGGFSFQREDGSFDESGGGQVFAWWNVDPKSWADIISSPTPPSPALGGSDPQYLGSAPANTCSFAILFVVPDAAPGDYPVVVVSQGGGGATLQGSVVVHVTS